jgi:hypothetical protein
MTEENKSANEWKQRELGALWKKEGKSQNYYSGKINLKNLSNSDSVSIVGFANKSKKEYPNSPDVILYASSSPEVSSSESTKVEVDDESPML